jgi:hypothetical protein
MVPVNSPHYESLMAQVASKMQATIKLHGDKAHPPFLKAIGKSSTFIAQYAFIRAKYAWKVFIFGAG